MPQIQPRTFDQLNNLIVTGHLTDDNRTVGNQILYQTYVEKLNETERHEILISQQAHNKSKTKIYCSGFTINSFPYDLLLENLPHVKHYLLWYRDWNQSEDEIQDEIKKWIKALFKQDLDYCFLVNHPEKRTIKNKPHAHVFIDFEIKTLEV
jgi:hypothetical protein